MIWTVVTISCLSSIYKEDKPVISTILKWLRKNVLRLRCKRRYKLLCWQCSFLLNWNQRRWKNSNLWYLQANVKCSRRKPPSTMWCFWLSSNWIRGCGLGQIPFHGFAMIDTFLSLKQHLMSFLKLSVKTSRCFLFKTNYSSKI